jgi:hypothetical protein
MGSRLRTPPREAQERAGGSSPRDRASTTAATPLARSGGSSSSTASSSSRRDAGQQQQQLSHEQWLASLREEERVPAGGVNASARSKSAPFRSMSRVQASPLADPQRYRAVGALDATAGLTPLAAGIVRRDVALANYLLAQTEAVCAFSARWLAVDLAGAGAPARRTPPALPPVLLAEEELLAGGSSSTGPRSMVLARLRELEGRIQRAEADRCGRPAMHPLRPLPLRSPNGAGEAGRRHRWGKKARGRSGGERLLLRLTPRACLGLRLRERVPVEMMGSQKYGRVGESQSALHHARSRYLHPHPLVPHHPRRARQELRTADFLQGPQHVQLVQAKGEHKRSPCPAGGHPPRPTDTSTPN